MPPPCLPTLRVERGLGAARGVPDGGLDETERHSHDSAHQNGSLPEMRARLEKSPGKELRVRGDRPLTAAVAGREGLLLHEGVEGYRSGPAPHGPVAPGRASGSLRRELSDISSMLVGGPSQAIRVFLRSRRLFSIAARTAARQRRPPRECLRGGRARPGHPRS